MDLDESLNPEQKEAVLHEEGPLLILAGAGSGKTRVITHRIAHLIDGRGVEPGRILAVTFTNKAAGEMRERVERLAGETAGLWISTFHAFGARMLRRHAEALGRDRGFVIYDADDTKRLGRTVLHELDLDPEQFKVEKMLRYVERRKHRLKSPGDGGIGARAGFYRRYQRKLEQANAFDFADLIYQTWRLLSEVPGLSDRYRARFEHVLVDEFQDTDRAQYALLRLLCPPDANLVVVGDDDQSIYMWRDADVSHILGFRKDYPTARTVKLERNYRSTQAILEAAGAVIAINRERHPKTLWTERSGGQPVSTWRLGDEREEAEAVAAAIHEARALGEELAGMAIFYRVNAQSRALEEALRLYGLPYVVVGGTRFFDRKEIRDVTAYLRLALNPASDVDLLRVINVPARGIGARTVERLVALAAARGTAVWQVLDEESLGDFRADARKRVLGFRALVQRLIGQTAGMTAADAIEHVLRQTGYIEALDAAGEGREKALARRENLGELVTAAMEVEGRTGDSSLGAFLEHVALVTDIDMTESGAEAVSLMTLHAAKGLEFDHVFLTGVEENLLPHRRSLHPDEEGERAGGTEEERRLCYVGMTRAKRRLVLSCADRRVIFGRSECNPPSRFLAEMQAVIEPEDGWGQSSWTVDRETRPRPADVFEPGEADLDDEDEIVIDYGDEYAQASPGAGRPNDPRGWQARRVEHPTFGTGRVIDASQTSRGVKLTVNFEGIGRKTLYADYVRVV